jgi:hypothetical protein
MELKDFKINDKVIQIEGFKKGRKGEVVENPYDGDEGSHQLGVLWCDNHSIGIQPVLPSIVKLED